MQKQKTIPATEFKKHFLQLIDQVTNDKNSFTITKRKIPVAQVIPLEDQLISAKNYFGFMKGITRIKEDIVNCSFETEWSLDHD